ncbi:hypothetical protein CY34DRAFT_208777, partial [Suillus luteus UH-Slu-Lm8-n1]
SSLSTFHAECLDDIKEVLLHVTGFETHFDRLVLLQWLNSTKDDAPVTQIVQLTGQAGNYDHYAPVVVAQIPPFEIRSSLLGHSLVRRETGFSSPPIRSNFGRSRSPTTAGFGCESCWWPWLMRSSSRR